MTRDERKAAIEALYMAGKLDREIDTELGLGKGATAYWRRRNNCPPNGFTHHSPREYAVYNLYTDELLVKGAAKECSSVLGMTIGSFYSMVARVQAGRNYKYSVVKGLSTLEKK